MLFGSNIFNYNARICSYLYLIRNLTSTDIKNDLFEQLISGTNTATPPNDDPYEDPPSLRHKPRKAQEMFNNDKLSVVYRSKLFRNSIFNQLYLQLKYLDNRDLGQHQLQQQLQ